MLSTPEIRISDFYPDRTTAIITASQWAVGHKVSLRRTNDSGTELIWTCACSGETGGVEEEHDPLLLHMVMQRNGHWVVSQFNPGMAHIFFTPVEPEPEHVQIATWRKMTAYSE